MVRYNSLLFGRKSKNLKYNYIMRISPIEERMDLQTIKDLESGCWLWKGYCDKKGYGRLRFNGKITRIHRISAIIYLGLDVNDKKLHALHKLKCINKNCWNPDHLYIGSNAQNMQDKRTLKIQQSLNSLRK